MLGKYKGRAVPWLSADGGPWLTLGCVAILDLILLFLVTLVVVFGTLATVSMLLKAIYAAKLFPTSYY